MKLIKTLTALIILILLTGPLAAWTGPAQSRALAAPLPAKETFETLCGRLAFVVDPRTGQNLIGLIPCGKNTVYIFDARPGVLHDYYRLHNVVVEDGPPVTTQTWGRVTRYITKFTNFEKIEDCRHCQRTAPTRTPNLPTAAQNCAGYLFEAGATVFPEIAAGAPGALQALEAFSTEQSAGACAGDDACTAAAVAHQAGRLLGQQIQPAAERRDALIGFLIDRLADPAAGIACPRLAVQIPLLAAGLSQEGFAIDALAITSPATHRVSDPSGRQAGFLDTGAPVEAIPGSRVAVTAFNKLILLPAGVWNAAQGHGVGTGPAQMNIAVNRGAEVWLAEFRSIPFTPGLAAHLDLAGSAPALTFEAASGQPVRAPNSFELLAVERSFLPTPTPAPTATPPPATETPRPTATHTPRPTAAPASPTPVAPPAAAPTPTRQSPAGLFCPSAPLAALGISLLFWRRQRASD